MGMCREAVAKAGSVRSNNTTLNKEQKRRFIAGLRNRFIYNSKKSLERQTADVDKSVSEARQGKARHIDDDAHG